MTGDNSMEKWLRDFPPPRAEERENREGSGTETKKERFPARLDLHGMTRKQASARLREFIKNSVRGGLRKVLVIHGRGLNSEGGAVLPALVRAELEENPDVLDFGAAEPSQGGNGAMQVFLRQDKRRR